MSAPTTTPYGGIVLGPFDGQDLPDGCVVYGDEQGEWLVLAPALRRQMRSGCTECEGHDHGPM